MDLKNISISQIVTVITSTASQIIAVALILLIGAAALSMFGINQGFIPVKDGQSLAWLCGAWWLYRK